MSFQGIEVQGTVIKGKQIGRQMGFPTANLALTERELMMPKGVYLAELTELQDPQTVYSAILNQGMHPTLPDGPPSLEIHLLFCQKDLYGLQVKVKYLEFMRPEMAFASKEELRKQVLSDIAKAKEWFLSRKS